MTDCHWGAEARYFSAASEDVGQTVFSSHKFHNTLACVYSTWQDFNSSLGLSLCVYEAHTTSHLTQQHLVASHTQVLNYIVGVLHTVRVFNQLANQYIDHATKNERQREWIDSVHEAGMVGCVHGWKQRNIIDLVFSCCHLPWLALGQPQHRPCLSVPKLSFVGSTRHCFCRGHWLVWSGYSGVDEVMFIKPTARRCCWGSRWRRSLCHPM